MKILAISHSCAADVNQQWYVALSELPNVSVELVVPSNWRDDCTHRPLLPMVLSGVRFPVHFLPVLFPGHISLHLYRRGLAKVLGACKPDVVFVDEEPWSFAVGQAAFLCGRLGIPFVCYTKQNLPKRYPPPFSLIEKMTYRRAGAIVALTGEVRDVLHRKGFDGVCPVIPHACDNTLFYPGHQRELRRQLGLRELVAGYLGRLVSEKGLDTLLTAFFQLPERVRQRCSLLLAGAGPEEQRLRKMAGSAGMAEQVVFAGAVPHRKAGDYLRCMDVLVLPSRTTPSWTEQFGRVLIEAMACEIPVVGSNSGSIPGLIEQTGGGMSFPEGDGVQLARQLATLLDDRELAAEMGRRGRRAVAQQFTYEAIAEQLRDTLEAVNGSTRKHSET